MNKTLWAIDKLFAKKIAHETRQHLANVAAASRRGSRTRAASTLRDLARREGPHVTLGRTEWGEPVRVPLAYLVSAHSIMTGGTGSGKTMAALAIVEAILEADDPPAAFGVLDAKGELFERTLCLVAGRLQQLAPRQAAAFADRIVIVDLSSQDPLTSYNIASPWSGSDLDFFATSRVDTFQELLPSGDSLSLRGGSIVKHVLKLLAEHHLPFSYFDRVLSSEPFRMQLLSRSTNEELRYYFRFHFPNEGKATIAAVRGRLTSSLLSSESLKLAFSGRDVPDFRLLQDEGRIVLINCAGPNIPRNTARTLQSLFLSDIRQAVFARTNARPFLWVCDEAQNFFRTRQLRENMTDLLTMARSYGSYYCYLTQNLSTAVQDGEMLETLHTNIRYSLSMRGTARDCAFLQQALPLTGRMPKPRLNPYTPQEFYSPAEERSQLLSGLAHLPDRTGWLWLKSLTGEAMKIKTKTLALPHGEDFKRIVDQIRKDARIGQRVRRADYLAEMARRDEKHLAQEEPDTVDQLKKAYQRDREATR